MSDETDRGRAMRKALTPPEAKLWAVLKTWLGDGFHFRRQAPLLGYWLDFVCFSRRLIIEIDGRSHETADRPQRDARRDAVLAREGFRTLRISADDVRRDFGTVLTTIRHALETSPSPSWGGTAERSAARVGYVRGICTPPGPAGHPPHEGEGRN